MSNCQPPWLFQSVSGSYWIGIKSYVCFDMKFVDFYQMERMANFPTKGSLDSLGLVSGSRLFPVLSTSSFYRHILSYLSRFGEYS